MKRQIASDVEHEYPRSSFDRRSNYKRFHGNKRTESSTSPEEALHNLIFLVGQKSSSTLQENIRSLSKVLFADSSKSYLKSLFTTIIECVSEMAWKTRIYSSLIGLLKIQDPPTINEIFIPMLQKAIDQFIINRLWPQFALSLRFLADLVTVRVVEPLSFLHSMDSLLEFIENACTDKQKDSTRSFLMYSILSSFLWNASVLFQSNEGVFRTLLVRIGNIMLEIKSQDHHSSYALPSHFKFDILFELYSLFTNMENWKSDLLGQFLLDEFINEPDNIDTLCQIRHHEIDVLYEKNIDFHFPFVRKVFRTTGAETLVEKSDIKEEDNNPIFTDGDSLLKNPILDSNALSFTIKRDNLESWLLSDIIIHTVNAFEENYHKCADFIIFDIQHSFPGVDITKLAIDCIISEMLSSPKSSKFPTVYYTMLIKDILTISDSAGGYLGILVTQLFVSLEELLFSQMITLSTWLAHHLSHFEFKWGWWAYWITLGEKFSDGFRLEPTVGIQGLFLQNLLSKMMRLSYYEQIRANIPDFFVKYLQEPPEPRFEFSEASTLATPDELALSRKLGDCIKSKLAASELTECTSSSPLSPNSKKKVLLQSILLYGSKSFSHSINALDRLSCLFVYFLFRYMETLGIAIQDIESQVEFLGALGDFWKLSPQFIFVIIDHLLDIKVLSIDAIFTWLYGVILANNNTDEIWIWELLINTILSSKDYPVIKTFIQNFISAVSSKPVFITSPELSIFLIVKESFDEMFSEPPLFSISTAPIVESFLSLV